MPNDTLYDFSDYTTHIPVMLAEVIETLNPQDGDVIVDGTFGAGGYTKAILDHADCSVVGIDQDPTALITGDELATTNKKFTIIDGNFGDIDHLLICLLYTSPSPRDRG